MQGGLGGPPKQHLKRPKPLLSSPHGVWGRGQWLREAGGPSGPLPPLVGASVPQAGREAGRQADRGRELVAGRGTSCAF